MAEEPKMSGPLAAASKKTLEMILSIGASLDLVAFIETYSDDPLAPSARALLEAIKLRPAPK